MVDRVSERKKQVWFRPDQVELTVECLQYVKARCSEADSIQGTASTMAKRFVRKRIDEILALFGPANEG